MSLKLVRRLSTNRGMFARWGNAAGNDATYQCADIDTLSMGLSPQGNQWHRSDDTHGLAVISNGRCADRLHARL